MSLEFPISLRGSVLLSYCVRVVAYSSSAAQLNLFHLFPSDRRNLVKKCFSKIGSVLSTRPDFRCNNKNSGISNKSDYPEKNFHQSLGQKNCWLGKKIISGRKVFEPGRPWSRTCCRSASSTRPSRTSWSKLRRRWRWCRRNSRSLARSVLPKWTSV